MSQLVHIVRRSPRRTRLTAAAVLVALAALMLVWIGRASADEGGPSLAAVSKTVANVPTAKADAVDIADQRCTVSPQFNDMPGTFVTFKLGGTASRPVIVLFQGRWGSFTERTFVVIRLTIDGVLQSGPAPIVDELGFEAHDEFETHGFNFISDPLAPGTHTATIQWRDSGIGPGCVFDRSLIVLHK